MMSDLVGVRKHDDVVEDVSGKPAIGGDFRDGCFFAIGPLPNVCEAVVNEELPISEDLDQPVLRGVTLALGDRRPLPVLALQGQAALLGLFAWIGDRVLHDIHAHTIHTHVRALECALLRVAVQLLQQRTAAAEGKVIRCPTCFSHRNQDHVQRLNVDAVTLDHADARRQQLVARGGHARPKLALQFLEHIQHDAGELAAVRAHHQDAIPCFDHCLELCAPILLACLVDVVAVAHTSYDAFRVLLEHVPHCIHLMLPTPAGHGAVLRCGDRKACDSLVVVVFHEHQGGHIVRAEEIDQVSSPTNCCRLCG
mmetsp:Transcript_104622/g.300778  ORF Transcript_104622/g.300778 Transcript_104622/m.300778 type:complete len:310 (-) Transcript_104622:334-1263(-)